MLFQIVSSFLSNNLIIYLLLEWDQYNLLLSLLFNFYLGALSLASTTWAGILDIWNIVAD